MTWEDATSRLLEAGQIAADEWPASRAAAKDAALWTFYKPFTGIDILRNALGAELSGVLPTVTCESLLRAVCSQVTCVALEQTQLAQPLCLCPERRLEALLACVSIAFGHERQANGMADRKRATIWRVPAA